MYKTILVTLDGTPSDRRSSNTLNAWRNSRKAGWCCSMWRTVGPREPMEPDAVSPEITEDTAYLEKVRAEFQSAGIPADAELAYGEPADEIVKWVEQKGCSLVAMSTHGHRLLADIFLGTTASRVQHRISVPVLLLRAK